MKNHLIIPLLILSVGFCQQKKTDKPNPMKGIKTQTVIVYVYENLIRKNISKYDSNGNKVEDSSYDSEGSLSGKSIYKYDSNRNKVEMSNYDSEGSLFWTYIYKYDSNGNMVERFFYDSDEKLDRKYIWKYNDKNRLVEIIKYKYELKFGELQQIPIQKTTYDYVEY